MANSIVRRSTAVKALKASGVEVHATGSGCYTLAFDGNIEEIDIPTELGSRLVHRLHRLYRVPKHWFYNDDMIPGSAERIQ